MDTWIIYKMPSFPYALPKVQAIEVQAFDVSNAIVVSGCPVNEILCVKLKVIEQAVGGI
ncbi:hypothetical protein KKE60_06000 [Patescibacteria group bacterium]|nr:hypothetical protein [Patescibacteria group bacterium]